MSRKKTAARKKARIRRTVDEAHRRILDATERRLIAGGPEGVRLQEIAADVGISHPGILHHFGSRDGLLAALAERATRNLERELLAILATRREGDPPSVRAERAYALFERVHELWTERGYARLFAALILSGRKVERRMRGTFARFARAIHENRVKRRIEDGRPAPSWDETVFGMTMIWITLFGDALFGSIARTAVGAGGDPATGRRFRRWLAENLEAFGSPSASRSGRTSRGRR
jgi:AcrR family transcriptional regulator